MKKIKWLFVLACLCAAIMVAGTTTYVVPGSNTPKARFYDSHSGLTAVDLALTSANQTVTLDSTMGGYLSRIVYWADGTDAAFSITVTDASSYTLFSKSTCTSVGDPYSFVVTSPDQAGAAYGGVPFVGGLTVTLADAANSDTTAVNIRLYISEQWRR